MTGHVYNITDVDHKECVLHTQLYVNETERPKLHKETGPLCREILLDKEPIVYIL